MPYPEFEPGCKRILFFSRGRGRSHAVQDMEIARHILELDGEVQIRFVSYGTGSDTFERSGIRHIDLGFPDCNPIHETLILGGKLIGWLKPDLVVSHEEFVVLPAAKIFDTPTVLLTDWFTEPTKPTMTTLPFADRIVFLDRPGHFEEPECVRGKVEYVGPVVRKLRFTRMDRIQAREELGVQSEAFVVAVLPGSSMERDSPYVELVLGAFEALPCSPKYLLWAAGADRDLVKNRVVGTSNVVVQEYVAEMDQWMAAADVALTKGTRSTMRELEQMGVPSVSLMNSANPIDNLRARTFPNNVPLSNSATSRDLAATLLNTAARTPIESRPSGTGSGDAATAIHRQFS